MTVKLHFNHQALTVEERQWFNTPEAIQTLTAKAVLITGGPYNRIWRWQGPLGQNYYIKIYHRRGHHLRKYIARSRARGEWENLQYFKQKKIQVPELLVYGESRQCQPYEGGFLVQREITSAKDLRRIAQEESRWHADTAWRRQLLLNTVYYLRQLHSDRFVHRDFKWRNIVVKLDDSMSVYLIDCPLGHRSLKPLYGLGWWRDLRAFDHHARRYLSQTDRLRLYLAYSQKERLTQRDKQVIAKIYGEKRLC